MNKKLCLSRKNKIVGGVCGGFAEYLGVDPSLVRIIFVILFFLLLSVIPIAIYIICWAIMPMPE